MTTIEVGLHDQHCVRLAISTQPAEIGEGAVRAKDVVGVVAAHLQPSCRHHQAFAGEGCAQGDAALLGIPGDRAGRRWFVRLGGPSLTHERLEGGPGGATAVSGLRLLLTHASMVARRLVASQRECLRWPA